MLLHGFTQTGASWRPIVDELARSAPGCPVRVPDLPGHGAADPADDGSSLAETAASLVNRWGRALYVGYSMGGRLALRLAVDHPGAVAGLVVVGATAGIDDPGERLARRRSDEALADEIETIGVDRFLDRWMTLPLFAGFRAEADDEAARRRNRATGLAASLRNAGTGTMDPPLWSDLGRITAPTIVVAGSEDTKFVALGERLVAGIGAAARFESLPGCGHTAHLERPRRFAALVSAHRAELRG